MQFVVVAQKASGSLTHWLYISKADLGAEKLFTILTWKQGWRVQISYAD
jgi:hypothetical protein